MEKWQCTYVGLLLLHLFTVCFVATEHCNQSQTCLLILRLGELNSWHLATATMKAFEGFLSMQDKTNYKLKWKVSRINNQQTNIADDCG